MDSLRKPTDTSGVDGASPRVLVTGGSGFIGSHVVDALLRRGQEPRIFDLRDSAHHENGSVDTVLGDATDARALERAMEGCEAVIHLSAMADVGHVQADPVGAERANARATAAVLEAARNAGVKRVIYGSTIWVYSDCPELAVNEDTRLAHPGHLYTATKLAGELYCRSYAELYGLDYTILRFGIPYGPRARVAAVVPAMVERALAGEPLTVAGDGSQGRRFVYVGDLAEGIVSALRPEAANRVYNLAGNETTTILEIAETVRDLLGNVEIVHTEGRPGDFGGKEVSSDRALRELGWRSSTPFSEGVRQYVEWRRAHEPVAGTPPAPAVVRRGAWRDRLAPRVPALRLLAARRVLTSAATAGALAWGIASDNSYAVLTSVFGGGSQTHVNTNMPEVGLLVDAPPALAPPVAAELRRRGAVASIALNGEVSTNTLATVKADGSEAVPRLKPGGPVRWIGTRSQIKHMVKELDLHGHVYYAPPAKGFEYIQSLLGHTAGASPVRGAIRLASPTPIGPVKRGEIVEITARPGTGWRTTIDWVVRELRARGLSAVTVTQLERDRA